MVISDEILKRLAKQSETCIDGLGYGEGNIEKFAELIVQECINVLQSEIDYQQIILIPNTQYKINCMAALTGGIGRIKRHFGVTE